MMVATMKTFVAAVVLMAILAGAAFAQGTFNQTPGNPQDQEQAAKAQKERTAVEKEYNETMKRTRSQAPAPKSDPWSAVRAANDAKRLQ